MFFFLTFSKEVAASNQIYRFHTTSSLREKPRDAGFFTNFDEASWGPAFEDQAHGTHHEKGSTNQYGLSFRFEVGKEISMGKDPLADVYCVFPKIEGKPKMDGYNGKTRLKWMSWGSTIFGNIHMAVS